MSRNPPFLHLAAVTTTPALPAPATGREKPLKNDRNRGASNEED